MSMQVSRWPKMDMNHWDFGKLQKSPKLARIIALVNLFIGLIGLGASFRVQSWLPVPFPCINLATAVYFSKFISSNFTDGCESKVWGRLWARCKKC